MIRAPRTAVLAALLGLAALGAAPRTLNAARPTPAPRAAGATMARVAPLRTRGATRERESSLGTIRAGAYDIVRYNGAALPALDRVATGDGYGHVARLERGHLLLRADGRFLVLVVVAHDYRALTSRWPLGTPMEMEIKGRWVREGAGLRLLPALPKRKRLVRPLVAVPTATGLQLRYTADTPTGPHRLVLDLRYDPNTIVTF